MPLSFTTFDKSQGIVVGDLRSSWTCRPVFAVGCSVESGFVLAQTAQDVMTSILRAIL